MKPFVHTQKKRYFSSTSHAHSKIGHVWFKKGTRTQVKVKIGRQNFYLYSAQEWRDSRGTSY
jgi:hypothetical protein